MIGNFICGGTASDLWTYEVKKVTLKSKLGFSNKTPNVNELLKYDFPDTWGWQNYLTIYTMFQTYGVHHLATFASRRCSFIINYEIDHLKPLKLKKIQVTIV